jgi:hypothetical protein
MANPVSQPFSHSVWDMIMYNEMERDLENIRHLGGDKPK